MARQLLRRSAAAVLGSAHEARTFSGRFLATTASPSAAGHLGLVHPRPALVVLNEVLTKEAFLLDATHALGAAALRCTPVLGAVARTVKEIVPKVRAEAEARGDAKVVHVGRLFEALLDAQEGRLGEALDALERQAAEQPGDPFPRLCAAAVCDLLGRVDEADGWLACVTGDSPTREDLMFKYALVAATLGGPPCAVAGSQGAVASAALLFVYQKLWGCLSDSDGPLICKMLATVLLRRVVKAELPAGITLPTTATILRSDKGRKPDPISPFHLLACAGGGDVYVLQASQALMSAVLVRAPPLCAVRLHDATRAAERDLASAVENGNGPAAADLRLILAFLAARDGRFEEAVERYMEAVREHPSDPRPHCLLGVLFRFAEHTEESDGWQDSYQRLSAWSSADELAADKGLQDELVIAVALGGARTAFSASFPLLLQDTVRAAASRVDAALVSSLQGKCFAERLEIQAARALVFTTMRYAVRGL